MTQTINTATDWLDLFPDTYIFPIKRGAKYPPCFDDNLKLASNDIEQIKKWDARFKTKNWGVSLKKSLLICVDVDMKEGKHGAATFDDIALLEEWPKTFECKSPSGGRHLYYKLDNDKEFVNALGKRGFGLDIDSPNYALIPGSELANGSYEITNNAPIARRPDWFFRQEFLGKAFKDEAIKSADASTAVVDLDLEDNVAWAVHFLRNDAPPAIEGRGGEHTTLKVAMTLRDHGISETMAVELMDKHYNVPGLCDPLWELDGDQGLIKKINNAYTYANINAPGEATPQADFEGQPYIGTLPDKAKAATVDAAAAKERAKKEKATLPTLQNLAEHWVYIGQQEQFVRRKDCFTMSTKAFNAYFQRVCKGPPSTKLLKSNATPIRKFDTYCFEPGAPELGGKNYNLYRASEVVPVEGDTKVWDEHLEYLFPDEKDRGHVLDWLAWVYQNPGRKPKHMLIIQGAKQGTGKSFIGDVFGEVIGIENTTQLRDEIAKGSHNGWARHAKLIRVEEVRQGGKNEVARALHDMITQEWITINEKNVPHFKMRDYIAWLGFTNKEDALTLDESDRRYLVVRTPALKQEQSYYKNLYGTYWTVNPANPERDIPNLQPLGAVAHLLKTRELHGYTAQSSAPETHAKAEMIIAGMSDLETWMVEHAHEWPLNSRVMCIDDVIDAMPKRLERGIRISQAIANVLVNKFKGVKLGQQRVGNDRKSLWAINGGAIDKLADAPYGSIYLKDKEKGRSPAGNDFDEAEGEQT